MNQHLYKAKKFEGLDYDTESIPADMYKEVFGKFDNVFKNMFRGFTPKVVPKLSTDQIKKLKLQYLQEQKINQQKKIKDMQENL